MYETENTTMDEMEATSAVEDRDEYLPSNEVNNVQSSSTSSATDLIVKGGVIVGAAILVKKAWNRWAQPKLDAARKKKQDEEDERLKKTLQSWGVPIVEPQKAPENPEKTDGQDTTKK